MDVFSLTVNGLIALFILLTLVAIYAHFWTAGRMWQKKKRLARSTLAKQHPRNDDEVDWDTRLKVFTSEEIYQQLQAPWP